VTIVTVRPVIDSDIPGFAAISAVPDVLRLGAFEVVTAGDATFEAAWQRLRAEKSKVIRTAEANGDVIGYVLAYDTGLRFPPLDYTLDGTRFGPGIAADAFRAFLTGFPRRPVSVWVAAANLQAIDVLESLSFARIDRRDAADSATGVDRIEFLYELTFLAGFGR